MAHVGIRSLNPATYAPGVPVVVSLQVTPDSDQNIAISNYGVVERITPAGVPGTTTVPTGWTVTNIDNNGSDTGEGLAWVFMDTEPRTLHYTLTPPGDATGAFDFSGVIGSSGFGGYFEYPIGGMSQVEPGAFFPCDLNQDLLLSMPEVTAYIYAFKQGDAESFSGISFMNRIAYVTRAIYLFQYPQGGFRYRDDGPRYLINDNGLKAVSYAEYQAWNGEKGPDAPVSWDSTWNTSRWVSRPI
jgi:hypothetical protein